MIGDAWIEDYPQYTTCILYNLLLPGKGEKKKRKRKKGLKLSAVAQNLSWGMKIIVNSD